MCATVKRDELKQAIGMALDSVRTSPGMQVATAGPLAAAAAPVVSAKGLLAAEPSELADLVVFVADGEIPAAELAAGIGRARDGGTVVCLGDGPLAELDVYSDVHRRGLRLTFHSLSPADAG